MSKLLENRASGVLLHPTSLPGPFGVGDLGKSARRFVDWLASAGQQAWQVLPLNPTSHGNSPYASPSAFAGNTLLISMEMLLQDGLLDVSEINRLPTFPRDHVDFSAVQDHRAALFTRVHQAFRAGGHSELRKGFEAFCRAHAHWLDDHALFHALHRRSGYKGWTTWETGLATRQEKALQKAAHELADEVEREKFLQFLFARQWASLRAYAGERGISIIGDAPIFVAFDSADCWAHRALFKLDKNGERTVVAGVPPDYFAKDGQLWGNPLYDWEAMAQSRYAWWIDRIRALTALVDVIRIDHFRGFAAAWEVPATARTARKGKWVKGPGRAVFDAIRKKLGTLPLIAEDLGVITPDVEELRDGLGLPGMKILQFAFGDADGINPYLPHNHVKASVVYTGTHDNDTTAGWFQALDATTRTHWQHYLSRDGADAAWDMIRLALSSVAQLSVVPAQDLLALPSRARFNTPGVAAGNWEWRLAEGALDERIAQRLGGLTHLFGRHPGAARKLAAQAAEKAREAAETEEA